MILTIAGGGMGLLILQQSMSEKQYFRFFSKLVNALTNISEDGSVNEFIGMEIPPISFDMLIGTGIYRGYTPGGTYIWNDSGYIQMYAGLGMIVAIFFYFLLLQFYMKLCHYAFKEQKTIHALYFIIFVIILFIAEIKEPFILKYILPMFGGVAICLYCRRSCHGYKN